MSKSRKKHKGVVQENRTVYFNLADPEQKLDYEFTYTLNFSREVREMIRSKRLGLHSVAFPADLTDETVIRLPEYEEADALQTML